MIKLVLPASRNPVNKYTGTSIFCSELKSENLLYFIVVDTCSNYTKSADNTGCAVSYVRLCGYVIKMDPLTVCALNYALCAKDHAVGIILRERLENRVYTLDGKLLGSLTAKAGEHLVSVMMVSVIVTSAGAMLTVLVMIVVMLVLVAVALLIVMVMMLVIVAAALLTVVMMLVLVAVALLIVVVMLVLVTMALFTVVMLVIVAMALLTVVMMLVLVTAALFIVVVVMLVFVTAALFIVVVMVLVIVTMALFIVVVMLVIVAVALFIVVMMVMMVLMLFLKSLKRRVESILFLHSGEDILAVELVPRSGYNGCCSVVLSDKLNCAFNLLRLGNVGMRKNYRRCVSNLIVIELAKVLHIHLALIYIGNGGKAVKLGVLCLNRLYRLDYIGELTYSAGLDDNSVGMEFVKHLNERL